MSRIQRVVESWPDINLSSERKTICAAVFTKPHTTQKYALSHDDASCRTPVYRYTSAEQSAIGFVRRVVNARIFFFCARTKHRRRVRICYDPRALGAKNNRNKMRGGGKHPRALLLFIAADGTLE